MGAGRPCFSFIPKGTFFFTAKKKYIYTLIAGLAMSQDAIHRQTRKQKYMIWLHHHIYPFNSSELKSTI